MCPFPSRALLISLSITSSFLAETKFSVLKESFHQAHSEVAGVLMKARTRLMFLVTEQCKGVWWWAGVNPSHENKTQNYG